MRIGKDKSNTREASFKEDKNINFEMDVTEAKFVRRLKKGSGKYKGKIPFKCFNCGKINHFASKFPHKQKRQTSDDEENYTFKKYNKEAKYKKKSLCANNVDSSEETDTDSSYEDKMNNFMLMAIEDFENEYTGSDLNDEEVMVDMEGELISAMEDIDRRRLKKRKQKQLLIQYKKNGKEPSEDIALLKLELEEANKI